MKSKDVKLKNLFETDQEDLKLKELMEVQGGTDEDLDEDCYAVQCLFASNCVVMSCVFST